MRGRWRWAAASLLLLFAACGDSGGEWRGHQISGVMPDLAYDLTSETGNTVSAGAYGGKIRLLFFGYTHCPDICPVTLARLKAAIGMLPAEQQDNLRVLFVSVDPARDGPQRLREYTTHFGEQFVGLTGSQDQLRTLTRRYRVTYGYGETNDSGFYEVSHSSGVFVFGRQGEIQLLFNQSLSPDEMAEDLRRLF
jgi:protein SCO1/2